MDKAVEITSTSKLGSTRAGERTRIWLEGQRLIDHGFRPKTYFRRTWSKDSLQLERIPTSLFQQLAGTERGTVSGRDDKPIIDIAGQKVVEVFGAGTHVTVSFHHHRIVIRRQ